MIGKFRSKISCCRSVPEDKTIEVHPSEPDKIAEEDCNNHGSYESEEIILRKNVSSRTSFHQDINECVKILCAHQSPLRPNPSKNFSTKKTLSQAIEEQNVARQKSKSQFRRPNSEMVKKIKRKKKDVVFTQKILGPNYGSSIPLRVGRCSINIKPSKFHLYNTSKQENAFSIDVKNFSTEVWNQKKSFPSAFEN
ncbi:unnamed protein product [Moneuplotes crassus]|uniref:Uncharacterized protein n=1 Tax=Euplotes crassus TaxID=5936 RepID=A0AAD1UBJ3_EUPCR|nr:unnamed protein product [Moneuplotes crassus]